MVRTTRRRRRGALPSAPRTVPGRGRGTPPSRPPADPPGAGRTRRGRGLRHSSSAPRVSRRGLRSCPVSLPLDHLTVSSTTTSRPGLGCDRVRCRRCGARGPSRHPSRPGGARRVAAHSTTAALRARSRPPVEARAAVGVMVGEPGGIVGAVVVERAQQLAVGEIGTAALGPRVASSGGLRTRRRGSSSRRWCIRGRGWRAPSVEPVRTAGRSGRGRGPRPAAEDDGDDPGLAGQPPGLLGGDPVAGAGLGHAQSTDQGVEVEGDHHAGAGAAVGG